MDSLTLKFKVLLLGDSGVGKTSILKRRINDTFSQSYLGTIGIDYGQVDLQIEGVNARLQVWDTAGQERFKSLVESYYRGATGVVIVFDMTNEESFLHVHNWIQHMEMTVPSQKNIRKVLVGNKKDMGDPHGLHMRGLSLAHIYSIPYFEVSAKTGDGIDDIFYSIGQELVSNHCSQSEKEKPKPSIILKETENANQSSANSCQCTI